MESVEIKLRRSGNLSKPNAEIGDYRKVTLVNGSREFYYSVSKSNIQKKRRKETDKDNKKEKKPRKTTKLL